MRLSEPKVFPKVHVQHENRCFDIVDKCCKKIIEKSKTGDNWSKIFEREMCLTKIKYPFLSVKQIRGKALQQLGIPNFMGDIVRFGTHKVTGNLAKELNLGAVKKESRIPPPFKFCRKPHVKTIEKEMNKLMQTSVSYTQDSSTRSEIPEPRIDENKNVTPRKSKNTDTTKHSPKKLFNFTPNFFRKRTHAGKCDDEDEIGTPKKVSKMARENITDWKGYLTDSSAETSPLNTGDNKDENVDKLLGKLKIECENVIYSQLSETSRRELLGNSPESIPKESVTKEVDDDPQIYSQNLSNLTQSPRSSFPIENPINREFLSPPIFSQTQTKRRNEKKPSAKNSPYNPNVKVRNPMFRARRNLANQWQNDDKDEVVNAVFREIQKSSLPVPNAIINQQLSFPYFQSSSEYIIPSPEFVSPGNFSINHHEKKNRDNAFASNHITVPFILQNYDNNWENVGHSRKILKEIQQPSNLVLNPFKTENSSFYFGSQVFSFNENKTCTQIYKSRNLINTHIHQKDENSAFQAPRSFINCPSINNILFDSKFKSSQGSVYSPIKKELQAEDNNNLYRFDSISTISINCLDDEEKVTMSQLISPNGMEITPTQPSILMSDDEQEQISTQRTTSSVGSRGDTSSARMPSMADKINLPNEENVSNLQSQEEIPGVEMNVSRGEINFSNNENSSQIIQMMHSNIDHCAPDENVSNAHTFSQSLSQKQMTRSEEISSLQVSPSVSHNSIEYVPKENLQFARESPQSSVFPTQSTSSMSPLPTDNYPENPWLNVTSQDFSQRDNLHFDSLLSQDSGQASQNTLDSPRSFISTTPEQSDNDADNDRALSLNEMLNVKVSTVKKNVKRIINWLECEN